MKKIIACLLVLVLALSMFSCGKKEETDEGTIREVSEGLAELADGDVVELESNTVINCKKLTFSGSLDSLGSGKLVLGHGKTVYSGSYIEIDNKNIYLYAYNTELVLQKTIPHGLDIKKDIYVCLDSKADNAGAVTLTLKSNGKTFESGFGWSGRQGAIFAEADGCSFTDVDFSWSCHGYTFDVYAIGDSYFNPTSTARWTSYLFKNGYNNNLLFGYPGMASKAGISEFKQALTHGIPKYAVWCMGMNDGNYDTWLSCITEFIELCEENEITPIISTVPCVPTRDNSDKNKWVKESGYQYIDFAAAVGGEEAGSEWDSGLLYDDGVHPTDNGAKQLYKRAIKDFPELKGEENK